MFRVNLARRGLNMHVVEEGRDGAILTQQQELEQRIEDPLYEPDYDDEG
jgi:hypothetical protein